MRSLLFASAAIALAAMSAPGLITRYLDPAATASNVEAAQPLREAPERRAGTRQVHIEAERDGHFYVDAEINLRPVRLMVDTGASVVALRQSDAAAVGIRPRGGDFDQPVATANGTAFAAATELDSVAVQDVEVSGVRALILPDEQLSVSLLGASFLNRLGKFQVESGTLIFEN